MQLFYREQGEGFPIIILHGLFGSSDNWLTVTKKLSENYNVYLLDMRNHGRSPHSEEFTYDAMAEDIKEFMDSKNFDQAYVIGHSMGGKAAMKLSILYPERIKKLIVVDIGPKFYPRHHDTIIAGLKSIPLQEITTRQEADDILTRTIPELFVRQFLLKNLSREENQFKWRINIPVIEQQIENVGEALDSSLTFEKPTLFIRGGKSHYILDNDFDLIKQIFTQAEISTIASAGHWVQAEAPVEFLDEVEIFLNKA